VLAALLANLNRGVSSKAAGGDDVPNRTDRRRVYAKIKREHEELAVKVQKQYEAEQSLQAELKDAVSIPAVAELAQTYTHDWLRMVREIEDIGSLLKEYRDAQEEELLLLVS
jgi:uncharacterized protein YbaA (DUF1428 family)